MHFTAEAVLTPDGIAERIKLAARLLAKEHEVLEKETAEFENRVEDKS